MIDYPKDLKKNIIFRNEIRDIADRSKKEQEYYKEICLRSPLFFFNVFVVTYDPRRPIIKAVPFITYPFQDDVILWDKESARLQVDSAVEKSRDMGATWMFVTNDLHDWLFSREKIEIRWGSRKEMYVDTRGDMDSIFEKFRFILRNLPNWMLPKEYNWKEHDNSMRLINPETDSSITGEATNQNFARGGRKYRIRFDEFAFWENDERAWQSAADSTNCRTALSTPFGAANKFAEIAKSDIRLLSLHWTQHPKKNKEVYRLLHGKRIPINNDENPNAAYQIWKEVRLENPPADLVGHLIRSKWYDKECERRGSSKEVAEELDIDYARSGMPFFDLRMLERQREWTLIVRHSPKVRIPYERYILTNLVEIDNKMEIRESPVGWLRIFEMPVKGNQYIVSGDTSEGLEKMDESFIVVREKWSRNVVAASNGAYDPDYFATLIQKVGAFYNKCMVAPENNNHGFSVCSDLQKVDCFLYWTKKKNPKTGEIRRVKCGFTTTAQTRPEMLDQAREEIRKEACEVRDKVIISQMKTFTHNEKNGKPEALGKFKDDGVIAYAIGGHVIKEYPYRPKSEISKSDVKVIKTSRKKFSFGGK